MNESFWKHQWELFWSDKEGVVFLTLILVIVLVILFTY